jgi:hypothetical protein
VPNENQGKQQNAGDYPDPEVQRTTIPPPRPADDGSQADGPKRKYDRQHQFVSMLTPLARRVISRIRRLNRSKALRAITRLTSGPTVKLNPRNFRSCGRATALFVSFTLSLSFCVMNCVTLSITRCPARSLLT